MKRIELEMVLSSHVKDFETSKVEFEQYLTPARTAANLLHRADQLGDISNKLVLDLCAGTGMLGIGASLLGANVTSVEVDVDAAKIMEMNFQSLEMESNVIVSDVFNYKPENNFDTILVNPPFGIQQKRKRDMDFITLGHKIGDVV